MSTFVMNQISKMISEKIKENSFKPGTRCRILDVIDDLVLIWNKEESCLLSQSLNSEESKVQVSPNLAMHN